MGMVDEVSSGGGSGGGGPTGGVAQKGCFVMWQMIPNKWLIELAVGGHSIVAGSDGNVAWRHTPWLGSHAAKGAVRPLRRAFQASLSNIQYYYSLFAILPKSEFSLSNNFDFSVIIDFFFSNLFDVFSLVL